MSLQLLSRLFPPEALFPPEHSKDGGNASSADLV